MTPIVKAFSLFLVLAAVPACAKKNDVATLRTEATDLAKFYAPKLDALDGRVQTIFKRGSTIPANLPGIDAVGAKLTEARDMIVQLRGIVAPGPDGKSAVEKQADAAAKERKVGELEKLVHDTATTLDRGVTVINDDLQAVESWIAQYDRQTLRPVAPPPPGPAAPAAPPTASEVPGPVPPPSQPQPPVQAQPQPKP